MKKSVFVFIGFAACLFIVMAFLKDFIYDTPQRSYAIAAGAIGKNGERAQEGDYTLSYKIHYMSLVPAGTINVSRSENNEGPVFSVEASTDGSLADVFVSASARLESFFDKQTNLPTLYTETTTIKGIIKSKEIIFDRENGIAISGDRKTKINENTFDPLGAFVTAINFPYSKIGENYLAGLLSKDTLCLLKAKKTGASDGYFEVLMDVAREDIASSRGASLKMWLFNGTARIPLLIKIWTRAGYVSVTLEEVRRK